MRLVTIILAGACLILATAPAAAQESPDIRSYKQVGNRSLAAHIFRPDADDPSPAILLFHGGGWQVGQPEWTYGQAEAFRSAGITAIPIEYRLSDETTTPAEAVEDACDAFAWVRSNAAELGIDPDRIGAYGISAGGHLAAAAGTGACRREIRGPDVMALYSPALDVQRDGWFRRLMRGGDPADVSPVDLAVNGGPPTFIIQGERDTLTPAHGAELFCERLGVHGDECRIQLYPGVGHLLTRNLDNQESNFDVDPATAADARARIRDFMVRQGYIAE